MDEFVPYEIPMERDRERYRSPKNKQVAIDGMELPAEEWYCECFNSQASGSGTDQVHPPTFNAHGFDAFFDSIGANFDTLPTDREHAWLDQFLRALRMCNRGLHIMNEALAASRLEERTARFQAEQAEKEQDSKLRRAFREGKREVAALVRNRSTDFTAHFGELKKTQNSIGDYRECWGSVGVIWRMQEPEKDLGAMGSNPCFSRFGGSRSLSPVQGWRGRSARDPLIASDYSLGSSMPGNYELDS
ncbi:hypothetical protein F2Q68_00002029 [Brassica cretica]|uniref:Uncharacterized protein n=2 Tax=Brassica cretica TaxID=69181 RepID=A0A3N6QXK0_BRACR|nr:hypothetical protein F2Q68_00002029 [Brassica cretica]KAF3545604.1 hypothetical protein DY000_02002693 [Brassica cretica]